MATTALGCALLLARATSAQKVQTNVPLSAAAWTADLRSYGYTDGSIKIDYLYRLRMTHTDVSFLNDQEVVDTFEATVEDSPKTNPLSYHRILYAVILDPASGKVLRQLSWRTHNEQSWLVPRADGSFVVFLGDRLEFYSADLSPGQELKLNSPPVDQRVGIWFSSSPSGRTMLIQYTNNDDTSCVWVTGEAISSQQEKCEVPPRAVVSDEEVVNPQITDDNAGQSHTKVFVRKFQGPWRTLCDNSGTDPCNGPVFVTEDALLLSGTPSIRLSLERTDGKTIYRLLNSFENRPVGAVSLYAYGEKAHLLALPLYDQGESRYSFPHVRTNPFAGAVVYDVSKNKKVFQINSKEKTGIHLPQGLAISPAGDRLVIAGDGVLRCYDLPPRQQ